MHKLWDQLQRFGKIKALLILILVLALVACLATVTKSPSNDRNWAVDQQILPTAVIDGDLAMIKNIRDFEYTSRDEYTPRYLDKTFDLSQLKSVDYIIEELFSVAVAHTFLSFGFENGEYLSISAEIRKEAGEEFGPIEGLFNNYEIMYVVATETDLLPLRGVYRDNPVHLYPLDLTAPQRQALLVSQLEKINQLSQAPVFYNTLFNACTTSIVDHLRSAEVTLPLDYRVMIPKNSDAFFYEQGLIAGKEDFEEVKARALITPLIKQHQSDPNFSQLIRARND